MLQQVMQYFTAGSTLSPGQSCDEREGRLVTCVWPSRLDKPVLSLTPSRRVHKGLYLGTGTAFIQQESMIGKLCANWCYV